MCTAPDVEFHSCLGLCTENVQETSTYISCMHACLYISLTDPAHRMSHIYDSIRNYKFPVMMQELP